jgi:hypothetical protein
MQPVEPATRIHASARKRNHALCPEHYSTPTGIWRPLRLRTRKHRTAPAQGTQRWPCLSRLRQALTPGFRCPSGWACASPERKYLPTVSLRDDRGVSRIVHDNARPARLKDLNRADRNLALRAGGDDVVLGALMLMALDMRVSRCSDPLAPSGVEPIARARTRHALSSNVKATCTPQVRQSTRSGPTMSTPRWPCSLPSRAEQQAGCGGNAAT